MPEPQSQPTGGQTSKTDSQGKSPQKKKFSSPRDRNQKFGSNERDTPVDLKYCDQSRQPFPNRGPYLSAGHRSENGKRERSEVSATENNLEMTANAPQMPRRTWETFASGEHNNGLERGSTPVNPQKQKATASRGPREIKK